MVPLNHSEIVIMGGFGGDEDDEACMGDVIICELGATPKARKVL